MYIDGKETRGREERTGYKGDGGIYNDEGGKARGKVVGMDEIGE